MSVTPNQRSSNSLFSLCDEVSNTNVTSTFITPTNSFVFNNESKNIILLVGLPATGKSTISKQLIQYLNENTKFKTGIFNCGDKRRQTYKQFNNYEFFDPQNEISRMQRELIAIDSLSTLINELNLNHINIGILDATNTTIDRRCNLIKLIHHSINLDNLIILDIQCTDPKLINFNIQAKTKNDDYKNYDFDKSVDDFTKRLSNYRKAYEPITDTELSNYNLSSYIMIENGCKHYKFNNFKESELIDIINKYFIDYNINETRTYYDKVNEFYTGSS